MGGLRQQLPQFRSTLLRGWLGRVPVRCPRLIRGHGISVWRGRLRWYRRIPSGGRRIANQQFSRVSVSYANGTCPHVGVPRSKWNQNARISFARSIDSHKAKWRQRHTRVIRGTLIVLSTVVWDDEKEVARVDAGTDIPCMSELRRLGLTLLEVRFSLLVHDAIRGGLRRGRVLG